MLCCDVMYVLNGLIRAFSLSTYEFECRAHQCPIGDKEIRWWIGEEFVISSLVKHQRSEFRRDYKVSFPPD